MSVNLLFRFANAAFQSLSGVFGLCPWPYRFSPLQLLHMGTADGWHTQTLTGTGLCFAEHERPARMKPEQNEAHPAAPAAPSEPKEKASGALWGSLLCNLPVWSPRLWLQNKDAEAQQAATTARAAPDPGRRPQHPPAPPAGAGGGRCRCRCRCRSRHVPVA